MSEGVAQGSDQVLVPPEQVVDALLLLLQQRFDRGSALRVTQHPADDVGVGQRRTLDRLERHQAVAHAADTDHLCGDRGGREQVTAGAGRDVGEEQLLGHLPPIAIWIRLSISVRERVNTSSRSPCASSPRASRRLTIVSTSSLRSGAMSQATVAWPASWVAMRRFSLSVY